MKTPDTRTITIEGGKTYTLDRHGFLNPPEQWDEDFANGIAKQLGIYDGLTEEHWDFIRYLRKKFLEEKTVPAVVFACADNQMRLKKLRSLFPTGYHRGACKLAGINFKFMAECNLWLTYESYTTLKSEHRLTQSGFLEDFDQWNKRFAQLVASEWDLPDGLTDQHWGFIDYLRKYYAIQENIPTIFEACRENDIDLAELRNLFPDGYRRGACRAAGLPFFA
jgi:tRNA 2-thiouridine synthesizing protein E